MVACEAKRAHPQLRSKVHLTVWIQDSMTWKLMGEREQSSVSCIEKLACYHTMTPWRGGHYNQEKEDLCASNGTQTYQSLFKHKCKGSTDAKIDSIPSKLQTQERVC